MNGQSTYAAACWEWLKSLFFVALVFGVVAVMRDFLDGKRSLPAPSQEFLQNYYERNDIEGGYIPTDAPHRHVTVLPPRMDPPLENHDVPSFDGIERNADFGENY